MTAKHPKLFYRRKAWSLIEMFVILFLVVIISLVLSNPIKTIVHRIPHIQTDIQTNRLLLNVIDSIRYDIQDATDITITTKTYTLPSQKTKSVELSDPNLPPDSNDTTDQINSDDAIIPAVSIILAEPNLLADPNFSIPTCTETSLVITKSYCSITYKFANDLAERAIEPQIVQSIDRVNSWHIPKARLDMQTLKDSSDKPFALEISTSIVRKVNERSRAAMQNSHVLFIKEQD